MSLMPFGKHRGSPGGLFPLWVLCAALLTSARPFSARESPWKAPPEKIALVTGLPCIYQMDKSSPTSVIEIFIEGGRAAVPKGLDGLAYLVTRLALEIPDEGKVQDIMSQATRLGFSTLEDCSVIRIECLSESLEEALRVASGIIQDPLMTGLRIGHIKEIMRLFGRAEEDDSVVAARNAVLAGFFGGTGYGTAPYGTEESLKAIERKDATAFYRRFFTGRRLFFSVGTDLDRERIRALLEKYFTRFPEGEETEIASPPPILPEDREIVLTRETKQAYIGRAFMLPAPDASGHAQGVLLEVLLGKGPGSRLWSLRTTERLAYNVDTRLTWMKNSGILEAFLESDSVKASRAGTGLDRVLSDLWENGITEDELQTTKTMAKAHFLRSSEAKPARTRTTGFFEVLGLGFAHLSGFFRAIDSVSADAMNTYIRQVLAPGRALRVTVGPSPRSAPAL